MTDQTRLLLIVALSTAVMSIGIGVSIGLDLALREAVRTVNSIEVDR